MNVQKKKYTIPSNCLILSGSPYASVQPRCIRSMHGRRFAVPQIQPVLGSFVESDQSLHTRSKSSGQNHLTWGSFVKCVQAHYTYSRLSDHHDHHDHHGHHDHYGHHLLLYHSIPSILGSFVESGLSRHIHSTLSGHSFSRLLRFAFQGSFAACAPTRRIHSRRGLVRSFSWGNLF